MDLHGEAPKDVETLDINVDTYIEEIILLYLFALLSSRHSKTVIRSLSLPIGVDRVLLVQFA